MRADIIIATCPLVSGMFYCVPVHIYVYESYILALTHPLRKFPLHPRLLPDCPQGYIHHSHHAATCVNAKTISLQVRVCGG